MSTWIIVSWVCVAILTAVNVFVFLKLKGASEQMLKMAFPGAKDMNEAVTQMQRMMGGGGAGMAGMANMMRGMGGNGAGGNRDAQVKAAMEMLKNMQQKGPRK